MYFSCGMMFGTPFVRDALSLVIFECQFVHHQMHSEAAAVTRMKVTQLLSPKSFLIGAVLQLEAPLVAKDL